MFSWLGHVWCEQTVGDVKLFLSMVKERLKDTSRQEWHSRVENYCPEYLDYHPYPFAAPHIEIIQSYKERRVFSLLRTRSLPIKNNLLRLGVTNNNLCEKCSGTYVENEFHILFRCSAYNVLRDYYIPESFTKSPSVKKLNQLMKTNDISLITAVIKFILKSEIILID